ncbi:hypothetical protein ACH5RR_036011 [Cinchona calisaya]|uniref:Peroxiredoxin-like 2A n=1 Tax=Cinchona calisaya TaxID=153742 RepID=A0ABD2Y568_9GENT
MEDFAGNGAITPKLLEGGWDDVPALKLMNPEEMNALNMTQEQKDALQIRPYLHDCALMQYADQIEASGKCLPELLNSSMGDLSSKFGMRRGPSRNRSIYMAQSFSRKIQSMTRSVGKTSVAYDIFVEQAMADFKIKDGHVFKGIVASLPSEPRLCGCIQPPPVVDTIAPLSAIETISIQKLTPEYKVGMECLLKTKTPSIKASELWRDKTALLLCLRRPGCIMCRVEAHQLYSKKPIFDALGVQLFAVILEHMESEVKDFWPRYWGGIVVYDRGMEFFKVLGGGKLSTDKFISGFLLNPRAIANYKRAKATGLEQNSKGEGKIKGGLFIVGRGKTGIAYQFIERNFGDWAPFPEVLEICYRLQVVLLIRFP